ncbi:hypothetical protein [Limnoraphis robusta]|uniref:Uncharacterized protein n=1 Tax=Limnoraphis robusta CCNP1315 TaxID=3110306 RepID=A0ABU5TV09_9CYAN|nr:hypothetical protein [Limnoraphis robusta]MEA5518741.1 hypothetical protein [Limnoraphis robusta CCNP1315]MEA5544254.1 hypothetical protein [Limnoraphis robusta CCNP1324]
MTLSELKAQAQALGLTKEFVSEHGDLRYKSTWETALNAFRSQTEPETTVSDNLFEPLAEPEVINITRESYPEIWQHLEPPTEPETLEPLQLPNKSALYDSHWVMIGDWVKLDETHTCQVTHVLAENNVEVQVDETGEVLNVTPSRLRHLTEAELDEVDDPEFAIATEPEAVPVSYQVITESPSIPPIYFSRPEQKHTLPKLPGQDFFVWLLSPPKVSVINQ